MEWNLIIDVKDKKKDFFEYTHCPNAYTKCEAVKMNNTEFLTDSIPLLQTWPAEIEASMTNSMPSCYRIDGRFHKLCCADNIHVFFILLHFYWQ